MVEEVSKKKRTGDRERLEKSTNTVCSGKCHNEYPYVYANYNRSIKMRNIITYIKFNFGF